MTNRAFDRFWMAAGLLCLGLGGVAGAQAPPQPCRDGAQPVGWLGIRALDRVDSIGRLPEGPGEGKDPSYLWFGREPRILEVDDDAPAAQKLQAGDTLVSIDGKLITSRAAGSILMNGTEPDRSDSVAVRRNGVVEEFEVETQPRCPEDLAIISLRGSRIVWLPPPPPPPAPPEPPPLPVAPRSVRPAPAPSAPSTPREPVPPRAPLPPPPPPPPPPSQAWFGFGLQCSDCGWVRTARRSVFRFFKPPTIYSVDPDSPAHQAGLRRGDVVTHVGESGLETEEGARRFFAVEPGEKVSLLYRRSGREGKVELTAQENPDSAAMPTLRSPGSAPAAAGPRPQNLRYAGSIGNVDVQVRGLGRVDVTHDQPGGRLLIRTHNTTIELRVAPPK